MSAASWARMCQRLSEVVPELDGLELDPAHRGDTLRYLLGATAKAISDALADGGQPVLRHELTPWLKVGGDNPDGLYLGCELDGTGAYRLTGRRGEARVLAVTVTRGAEAVHQGRPGLVAHLDDEQLVVGPDGTIDIVLAPPAADAPSAPNRIELTPDSARLMVRQFFADWDAAPAELRIERLDAGRLGSTDEPDLDRIAERVAGAARTFAGFHRRLRANPNSVAPLANQAERQATPGGVAHAGWFQLGPDEALVLEFQPPQCRYWNVQLGTIWAPSGDYRHHIVSINDRQACIDADGRVRVVIAAADHGWPNWLDTRARPEGSIGMRWWGTHTPPDVSADVVAVADVWSVLPAAARVDPIDRAAEIAHRRRAVDARARAW